MRNNNCFNCLNHGEGKGADNTGWYHPCKLGISNEDLQDVKSCKKYAPNTGFQIGGYYSHIHFELDDHNEASCMNMVIHSDGEFPKENRNEQIIFHICDFKQIEHFVKEWGDYFRKQGIIKD